MASPQSIVPLPRRIVQAFTAPRALARSFLQGPVPWAGPLLISIGVSMLVAWAAPDEAFRESLQNPVDRLGRPVTITSDLQTAARYGRMLRMFAAVPGQALGALAGAGLLTLLFRTLFGGSARFGQYLGVTTHAMLVTALGSLLAVLLALLQGGEPAGVTLAALLPGVEGLAGRILAGIDLFTLYALAVAGIAVSVIEPRVRAAPATALLVGLYVAVAVVLGLLGA